MAFWLRIVHISGQSLWYDEGFSVYLARTSLGDITARTAADIQPPLYYYLLYLWLPLAGTSELAVRFPSVLASTLTIPLLAAVGRRLLGQRVGLLAALLLTLSPFHVWYANETRMYALLTMLLVLSLYATVRVGTDADVRASGGAGAGNGRWWAVLIVSNIAAVYTHYYAFFGVVAETLFLLIRPWRRHSLGAAILVAASYLPWAGFALNRYAVDESYWEGMLSPDFVRKTLLAFVAGHTSAENEAQAITMVVLILMTVGLTAFVASHAKQRPFILLPGLFLVVPFILLYGVSAGRPKFHPRYLTVAFPAFVLLMAAALEGWGGPWCGRRRILGAMVTAGLCGLFVPSLVNYVTNHVYVRDDFRSVAAIIRQQRKPDEVVLLESGHLFPVYTYYDATSPIIRIPDIPTLSTRRIITYAVADQLTHLARQYAGVWVVLWQHDVVDPAGILLRLLDEKAEDQGSVGSFWGVELRHYRIARGTVFPSEPVIAQPSMVTFAGGLTLRGLAVGGSIPAGDPITMTTYWRREGDQSGDIWVSWRVVDEAGHIVGQADGRPAGYGFPVSRWPIGATIPGTTVVPTRMATQPGRYELVVRAYRPGQGNPLDILDSHGRPLGVEVGVGHIDIEPARELPQPQGLAIPRPLAVSLGAVELLGTNLVDDRARPGQRLALELIWRAAIGPPSDEEVYLQIADQKGRVTSGPRLFIGGSSFPTSRWRGGEVVRQFYDLTVPADVSGRVTIQAVVDDYPPITLGWLEVEAVDRMMVVGPIAVPMSRTLGTVADFLGYDLGPTRYHPGDAITLTLYWRARETPSLSYSVFTHLLDSREKIWAQHDGIPGDGNRPTLGWVPGEVIVDIHRLTIRPDAPQGSYILEIGMYNPATGARLPVLQPDGVPLGDRILLGQVSVEASP